MGRPPQLNSTIELKIHNMKITVKASTMVKPTEQTPTDNLWLSNLDRSFPDAYHARWVNFYPFDGTPNFFDTALLKAALSRALVKFYPYAGRLRRDDDGPLHINCNAEGVFFLEAECDGTIDDLGGFRPRPDVSLVPAVDYSNGISSFPLSLLQLTRFKCGGVSLGIANDHHISDAVSALHFINTWSDIARGSTPAVAPWLDRRVLSARDPPRPQFPHVEHRPPPTHKAPLRHPPETSFPTFKLSRGHIDALKRRCGSTYTTYEVVAGHVWRCVSIARGLPKDQETKLQILVNARRRLRPSLPAGFFGNGAFYAAAFALCGELESRPLGFAVGRVHEAVGRMEDGYVRSALDYAEVNLPRNAPGLVRTPGHVHSPNLGITSWVRMPFYEADFGWGKPVYSGPGAVMSEGKSFLMVDPLDEGAVLLAVALHTYCVDRFQKLLYGDELAMMSKI